VSAQSIYFVVQSATIYIYSYSYSIHLLFETQFRTPYSVALFVDRDTSINDARHSRKADGQKGSCLKNAPSCLDSWYWISSKVYHTILDYLLIGLELHTDDNSNRLSALHCIQFYFFMAICLSAMGIK
jgi:hypothetical protein